MNRTTCLAQFSNGSILTRELEKKDTNTKRAVKRKNCDGTVADALNPCKRLKTEKPKSKALVRTISKPKPCDKVEIGVIVLCKMRGYPAWPAHVTGFEKKLICVQFYGDQTTHKASIKNFFKFVDSQELIISCLRNRKNPLYSKAIREAELSLGLKICDSILNGI